MNTVAVLGLGLMGSAIASRLQGAGFAPGGFDVDAGKRAAYAAGPRLESVRDAVGSSDVLVLAVFDTAQVEAVTEGAGGIAEVARAAGKRVAVICTSTCDPDRIAALAARCAEIDFIEMPVSGTSAQVARGEGVGLAAGDLSAIERVRDVIGAICPKHHYLGPCGNGGRAKLAVNLVLGLNRAAIAEGLAFAERAGLELESFFKVLRESAAYSSVMDVKGKTMVSGNFRAPQSRVDQSLKDFGLMLEYGARKGQALPFASTYARMLEDCVAQGEAQWDNAAIIQAIRRHRS
jgi:3-hydroxyisobutyrate dehydrogenase-like beta-hydroxyacid dehydrogenase